MFLLILMCISFINNGYAYNFDGDFVKDFLQRLERPATVVSHLSLTKKEHVLHSKIFFASNRQFQIASDTAHTGNEHVVHLLDCKNNYTWEFLNNAINNKMIRNQARWLLLLEDDFGDDSNSVQNNDYKSDIECRLHDIYIAMDREIYIALQRQNYVELFSVYKIKRHLPLIWENHGYWSKGGFNRPRPEPLAMRRRNLRGADVVAATVILDNRTLEHMPDYLHREKDTLTKLMYYMTIHLVEWVNGTRVLNRTGSWGYRQPDGRYDGVVREMQEGRADLSGSVMIPTIERSRYMNFVLPPAPVEAKFIFRKPALASVTNIYVLPFSIGVWMFLLVLILVSTLTLFLSYYREEVINPRYNMPWPQKLVEGLFETLCLVFQQGTASDPISITGRQILLLGLMAYMFLFTAYSANVVALLQSPTNDINSVEALLGAPLVCGAQDVLYNRNMFLHETRPIHRALSTLKILPQGENAYLSVDEGIRKVREGMYAFHVELTAGYDQIQKTFLEDEKCNLGAIKFMSITYPYLALAEGSPIKEQLRIGANRIMESGVQHRTVRRMLPAAPSCGAGAAVFSAVRLRDVAPALRCLLALAALAVMLAALELLARRRERRMEKKKAVADLPPVDISENIIS
ncbi:hypothetical protein MSG28_005867 [Choristoneura fumiferana]|uniref:Uncharacterized protein n=2 Tax=Choristoneura fumiferana TaxID=7141 RepID=A0ACC0L1V5_CHOFU|nr:hypothetical protein MSG28_005867 [Choristoneura fumiferana]